MIKGGNGRDVIPVKERKRLQAPDADLDSSEREEVREQSWAMSLRGHADLASLGPPNAELCLPRAEGAMP